MSGFNIITSDKVAGRVTLKIEDIPWDQALDIILESNNLGKVVAGNIMRIDTLDQILKSQKDKMDKTAFQDLEMDTVAISYVKAKEIEKYIKDLKILTDKRGSINSFEHTNTVTITDVPAKSYADKATDPGAGCSNSSGADRIAHSAIKPELCKRTGRKMGVLL